MNRTQKTLPVTFSGLKALIEFMSNYDGSWRDLVWEFDGQVSLSTLRRIYKGQCIPKRHEVLRALHLPLIIPVAVCPLHGIVHEKRCPGESPKPRKPSKTARRKRLVHDERWRATFAKMVRRGWKPLFPGSKIESGKFYG